MSVRASLLSSVVLVTLVATPATAQDKSGAAQDIVVTARRADSARTEQQRAPNLVNIQPAETIAKYPDVNAAEALSRVPGVALSIDTAEGRFVNIRGLDGNLNGATFGGVVLLNTQPGGTYFNAAGRAVEFDTVPIGAIDRIVVTKTGTPDRDAEGLGGTVELTPRTAIGVKRPFAEITVGGGIETFAKTGLYRDEVVLGTPFGGTNADGKSPFSVVLTQFLYNDRRTFDDIEAAYYNDQPNTPDKAFDALELRKYAYDRRRFGYSGELDFTPNDDHRIYVRASMAGYNESARRNRLEIDGLGDPVAVDPANVNGLVATDASSVKTLRHYDETHRNLVFQLGGVHHMGDVTFDWFGAYSRASYFKHFDYNSTFAGPQGLRVAYDNTTDPNHPAFLVTGPSITNTANYALDSINNASEYDRDREYSYAGNLALPLHLAADDELKFGVKLRYRRKTAAPQNFSYAYNGPAAGLAQFTNASVGNNFYGDRYQLGALVDATKVETFLNNNMALFSQNTARDLSRNAGGYFDDTENVTSGYVQYKADIGAFGLLAGARVERTNAVYRGIARVVAPGIPDSYAPASSQHDYTNIFPTVQLRYTLQPALIARATWSTGISRPGFYQTIRSTSVDVGAGTVTTGNPALKPTYGNNFDLSLEYYLPGNGILSLGLFDKEFRNYIVARTARGSYPGVVGIASINTFDNVSAHARGVEAAIDYKIPGLHGFGIEANGSYVDSGAQVRPGEAIALPGTFQYTANGALFYEAHRLKVRLAGQYESKVLFGIGGSRATDVFQDRRITLDFNGSYDVTDNISVYFNAKNLTNAPLRFYEGSSNRPIQREYYDATLEAGVKIRL
ncbi:TonB-dependent receptor [Sphingomonas sp. AR_OL41]|uniref:TonB-dependent receptor n=1 Tax=Sphingomonas sp. AR_OL41 TaxID=3042729 RepID=UPI002480E903|nr:TonB-dependent receptor [Sphingomonas sp. AR_OL41]MDH7975953.1 TonB-dependent receptor [Sphingomonas sp. AR_OL41]